MVKDTWYSYQCIGWKVHGGRMVKDTWYSYQCIGWKVHGGRMVKDTWYSYQCIGWKVKMLGILVLVGSGNTCTYRS